MRRFHTAALRRPSRTVLRRQSHCETPASSDDAVVAETETNTTTNSVQSNVLTLLFAIEI